VVSIDFKMSPDWLGDYDIRPVGNAVHEAGELLAAAFNAALSGDHVFPGMTGPVQTDVKAEVRDLGELEFVVTMNGDISKIENGIDPFDMKPFLINGPRHRESTDKKGAVHRYNIIPFFHDQNALPDNIKAMAGGLDFSYIVGHYLDGLNVTRNIYSWGGRLPTMLSNSLLSMDVSSTGYVHTHNRYSGMVKMKDAGLMTFRTVSDNSPPESWWNPGKPANPVTDSAFKAVWPLVEAGIAKAWREVLDKWLS